MEQNSIETTIFGVEVKELISHPDARGFFREVIRETDPFFKGGNFGQWSHSRMHQDVIKAWHYHHVQTDWWYVGVGVIETALVDFRQESPTFKKKMVFRMGDAGDGSGVASVVAVKIPPGVLHGCRVISDEAHLFYITSNLYNPQDEGRIPYNSSLVDHDWGSGGIVAERDMREFVPTQARKPLAL